MPLKISRILHAGYVFDCDGTAIAFDPIVENPFSRNCHAFPDVRFDLDQVRQLRLDAVFISHFHDDHLSLESLDFLDRATPIYLYCIFDELFEMIRALGFEKVARLQVDVPVRVGAIEVIPRRALDDDVDSLFQVRAAGVNVLNVVDSWIGPETLAQLAGLGPWDMVLWPFQTMREVAVIAPRLAGPARPTLPDDWLEQLQVLAPRYIVPSSCQFVQEDWSWYNHAMFPVTYRQFAREVGAALPKASVLRLDPSVSVLLDADGLRPAAPLPWVIPVGPQEIDFDYRPGLAPPATADIARRFPALSEADAALVLDFCRHGLLERYRDMELFEDSYFQQPRLWRLSLYRHDGAATVLHYRLDGDLIDLVPSPGLDEAPSWTTDVPLAKCHAALVLGESLTSMYMRINDADFDAATLEQLKQADITDDPLIRCLFNDAIGAYQAAQLKRLGYCVDTH